MFKDIIDSESTMLECAISYGKAKSNQDIEKALSFCTDSFLLEAPALGTYSEGIQSVRHDLTYFFEMYPDYQFICEHSSIGNDCVVLSGKISMSWSGSLPQYAPFWMSFFSHLTNTKKSIFMPAVAVFEFDSYKLSKETFLLDGCELAIQMGVPVSLFKYLTRNLAKNKIQQDPKS